MGVTKTEKTLQRNGMGLHQRLTTTILFCSFHKQRANGFQIAGVVQTLKNLSALGPVVTLVMLKML